MRTRTGLLNACISLLNFFATPHLDKTRQVVQDKVRHSRRNIIALPSWLRRVIIKQDMRMCSRNCDE